LTGPATPAAQAIAHPAATVLLLRDGTVGLEVLMITRHAASSFAAGALVFPGGRVDAADAEAAMRRHCRAVEGVGEADIAHRVAGIRESFEEVGILLARRRGEAGLISAQALVAIERELAEALGRTPSFADLLASGGIELATDLLVPYAHWITPAGRPKRFDTQFFLAPAPPDQVAAHDGNEAVASIWIAPAAAMAEADAKRASLVFATRLNLMKLARSATATAALVAARADKIVTICPELHETASGWRIRIPPDAGYEAFEMAAQGAVPLG
jgi:8-oxo-dGTP pyrophosphatase MutT (NUDIX family)